MQGATGATSAVGSTPVTPAGMYGMLPAMAGMTAPGMAAYGMPQVPGMTGANAQDPAMQQYWQQYWQYMMYCQWQMQQQQQPAMQMAMPQAQVAMPQAAQVMGQSWGQTAAMQPNDQGLFVLFVYHLPQNISEEMLKTMFAKYGNVVEIVIMRDDMNDVSSRTKGFGFVKYRTYQEAAAAVQFLNGAQLENKRLEVSFKLGKGQKRNA